MMPYNASAAWTSLSAPSAVPGKPSAIATKRVFPVSQEHKTGVKVGFYRERSHEVVDVPSCLLQSDIADKAGRVVRKWMHRYEIPAYNERSGTGLIPTRLCAH